jgi:hypothetical protein
MSSGRRIYVTTPRRYLPFAGSLLLGFFVCASVILLPQFAEIADIAVFEPHSLIALLGAVMVFCFLYQFWPDD